MILIPHKMIGGLWQAVSIPDDGNQCVINTVINMILNLDTLLAKLGVSKCDMSAYEQISSKSDLRGVSIQSLYKKYAEVYLNMANSERRNTLLDLIRSTIYDAHTKIDGMLSPSSVIHDILHDVIYMNLDVREKRMATTLLTYLSHQTNSEDVFVELNISEYLPDRTQITEAQKNKIDSILGLAMLISENNYVCTDMMLEVYASTEKRPTHVAYYNALENRIQNDRLVTFIPYNRFKQSEDALVEINGKRYNNLYLQTSDGNRVYYTPKLFHFQIMPKLVVKKLCLMGYEHRQRDTFVFHTIITITERIKAIREYIRLSSGSLTHTKARYGNKLKDTLKFYTKYTTMSRAKAREKYDNLKNRKYNFFEEFVDVDTGEVCKMDSVVYDYIFN